LSSLFQICIVGAGGPPFSFIYHSGRAGHLRCTAGMSNVDLHFVCTCTLIEIMVDEIAWDS
jgi:hypothetical protein